MKAQASETALQDTDQSEPYMFPCVAGNCLFKICEEVSKDFDGDYTESVDCFRQDGYFYSVNPMRSWQGRSFHLLRPSLVSESFIIQIFNLPD